jgi:hypothetical protein
MIAHITTLKYQGDRINVENGLYWRTKNPKRKFLSMNEVKAEVDRIIKLQMEKPT